MFNHSLASNRLVSLLLAFLIAACSSTANTPPPSPSPIVLATLPFAPTSLSVTRPAATRTATKIVTPTPELIKFPGYENVEYLPNDILLNTGPVPANIIQALAEAGQGGGCCDPCEDIAVPTAIIFTNGVTLCAYTQNEQVSIQMTRPNNSTVIVTTQTVLDFKSDLGRLDYCFDHALTFMPGLYQISVQSPTTIKAGSFEVNYPVMPTIFLSGSGCEASMVEDRPSQIFYSGFQSNEEVQIVLHKYSEDGRGFQAVRSWNAIMDENGRLLQYIALPKLSQTGGYVLVAVGRKRTQLKICVPGAGCNAEMEASAFVEFYGLKTQTNTDTVVIIPPSPIRQATPLSVATLAGLSKLIRIEAGKFAMGSVAGSDPFAEKTEKPQHMIHIADFWIEQTEVSNALYSICVTAGICTPPSIIASKTHSDYYNNSVYTNYPVINVNYDQAKAYCEWVGARLPTEAEWEKAARYPDDRLYPWGDTAPNSNLVNYSGNIGDTTPVTSYAPGATPLGVLNMAGNVWEWVADWYAPDYYSVSPDKDPTGPATGTQRVVRGGSYGSEPQFLRTTNRFSRDPNKGYDSVGFRCVTTTAP